MSVINKMLQDLDRRNAAAAAAGTEGEGPARPVKSFATEHHGHEWFWRIIAVLVLISVGWVGWVAYQLQPRSLATEQTMRIAMQPRSGAIEAAPTPAPAPAPAEPPAPVAVAPVVVPPISTPQIAAPAVTQPEAPKPADTFKLARQIETPITERKPPAPKPAAAAPKVEVAKAAPKTTGTVDKRASPKAAGEAGEPQFQRAVLFLKHGRVSEAEDQLIGALQANPNHLGARQTYVALLLEQNRVDAALGALRDAVALNPTHGPFLLTLARVHAEQRDYKSALDVMEKAGPAGEGADFQTLRGVVLRRMGRHADAVGAYQKAVEAGPQPGETWAGFGISLEATGRTAEAAQAYQRALASGRLQREVREFAETRLRALQ